MSISQSKFVMENKPETRMNKDEITPINSNPEQIIKLKLAYKRVKQHSDQLNKTIVDGPEDDSSKKSSLSSEKMDLRAKKFDFGVTYTPKYVLDRNRKLETSFQSSRPTPTAKILSILQNNIQIKLAERVSEEKAPPAKINYHVNGGFSLKKRPNLSMQLRSEENMTRIQQNFQVQKNLRQKLSFDSLTRDEINMNQYGLSKTQSNLDQSPSHEISKFIMSVVSSPKIMKTHDRINRSRSKILESFSP